MGEPRKSERQGHCGHPAKTGPDYKAHSITGFHRTPKTSLASCLKLQSDDVALGLP